MGVNIHPLLDKRRRALQADKLLCEDPNAPLVNKTNVKIPQHFAKRKN